MKSVIIIYGTMKRRLLACFVFIMSLGIAVNVILNEYGYISHISVIGNASEKDALRRELNRLQFIINGLNGSKISEKEQLNSSGLLDKMLYPVFNSATKHKQGSVYAFYMYIVLL